MHGKKIVQTLVGDKMAHQNNNNNKKKGVNDGINQRTNQKKEKCAHHPLKIKPTDIFPVNKKKKKHLTLHFQKMKPAKSHKLI